MSNREGHWTEVATGDKAPKRYVRCHRCKNASIVALWDCADGDHTCFGRANLDKNIEGLQGFFPWGGCEHDSKCSPECGKFKVLTKSDDTGYHWVRVCVIEQNQGKYHPLEIDGKSPCCIDGLLGKAIVGERVGYTCWGGKEIRHEGDELTDAWVLCVRERKVEKMTQKKQARRDNGRHSDSSSSDSSSDED